MEPNIQGNSLDDVLTIIEDNNKYFISIVEFSNILRFKYEETKNTINIYFLGNNYVINLKNLNPKDYIINNNNYYFETKVYEKILPIKISMDKLEMQVKIDSDFTLPVTQKIQNRYKRNNSHMYKKLDDFKNYQFDDRLFTFPVVDFLYGKSYAIRDYNGDDQNSFNNTSYQANIAMLFGGMDTKISLFDNQNTTDFNPQLRLLMSRTLLNEPKNALNLTDFGFGDVSSFGSNLFNNTRSGRGFYLSSFKDLVLSADKTIDLTGVLNPGWEVELYQNNQLISFRQTSNNGRYEFLNVPVGYGLNEFRLVFYGPYGEIVTENRDYYSGTSPVKVGEFGYNIDLYQANRFLIENKDSIISDTDKFNFDFMGYYGINDYITLMSGLNKSPDINNEKYLNFGTVGFQFLFSGVSFQYNTNYNFDNSATGHHFDVQGRTFLGDIFARYEWYGDLESPISFYNGKYLKNLFETRLTGVMSSINLPYFISYREGNFKIDGQDKEFSLRLSPNFKKYYNFTIENVWTDINNNIENNIIMLLQAQYQELGIYGQTHYQTKPSNTLKNFNFNVNYRWDKHTFIQSSWLHDFKSNYSDDSDVDTFSFSYGRLFSFGGLTFTLTLDSDKNGAISFNYNIGIGKVPNEFGVFTNAEGQISDRSTIYANVKDDLNQNIDGVKVYLTGLQKPYTPDENGNIVISDITPYQKTILTVDTNDIDDLALMPEFESKKFVLRPGAIYPLNINFIHKGGIEFQLSGYKNLNELRVFVIDEKNDVVVVKTPDDRGGIIFDNILYGKYRLRISTIKNKILKEVDFEINKQFESIKDIIKLNI